MYRFIFDVLIIFMIFPANNFIKTETNNSGLIQSFEYGAHVPGEKRSYRHIGTIPQFTPSYYLNITPTAKGVEKRFTYMRVEYVNSASAVKINFDHVKNTLTFSIIFPFMDTRFGVVGYSMPLKNGGDVDNDFVETRSA